MRSRYSWIWLVSIILGLIWLALALLISLSPTMIFVSFLILIPLTCACTYFAWALFTLIFLSRHIGDWHQLWQPIAATAGCFGLSVAIVFFSDRFDLNFHANKFRYLEVLALADASQLEYLGTGGSESNYHLPPQYAYLSFDGGIKATGKTIMFHTNCDPLTLDFCQGIGYRPDPQTTSFPLPNCPSPARWRPIFGESNWYVCK